MKFTRNYDNSGRYVVSYTAENGYKIKSNASKNIFTARMMKADFWYIYDSKGNRVTGAPTLKECKAIVSAMV